MNKMLKCDNQKCNWIGKEKELKKLNRTIELIWGCPKCGQIFFTYVYQKDGE